MATSSPMMAKIASTSLAPKPPQPQPLGLQHQLTAPRIAFLQSCNALKVAAYQLLITSYQLPSLIANCSAARY